MLLCYIASAVLCWTFRPRDMKVFCIALGMIWAVNKNKIDKMLDVKWLPIFLISIVLFGLCGSLYITVENPAIYIFSKMLSAIVFSSMTITFAFKLSKRTNKLINNPITQWLGKYSLEIYVVQGIFLLLRKGAKLYIQNPYIFIVVCISGTLLLSIAIKLLYDWLVQKCRPNVLEC